MTYVLYKGTKHSPKHYTWTWKVVAHYLTREEADKVLSGLQTEETETRRYKIAEWLVK